MANRKLEGPSVLPMVALVAVLLVQTVVCLDKQVKQQVAEKRKSLELARGKLKEIRVLDVINLDCDVRHRRATYKMLKHFEQEREQQIRELLAKVEGSLTVASTARFQNDMRDIEMKAMQMIQPIADKLAEACKYSRARSWAAADLSRKLRELLDPRSDWGKRSNTHSFDLISDPWDESEVDLKSDKERGAIAKAIQVEKEALEKDREQVIKFAEYRHCTNIQWDLLDWVIARDSRIKDVLARRFDSTKALRRAIFDVHSEQLDKLQEYDEKLGRACGEQHRVELLNLIEAYFHQRILTAIKGKTEASN